MRIRRGFPLFASGLAAMLLLSLVLGVGRFGVAAAQGSATATPSADMGDCVKALGIGKAGDSCINVIHASPDAPAVDVYLDGAKALSGLAFGKASGWVAVPAGAHHVQVTAAGGDAAKAVIDANVTLDKGAAYEIAATGLLAQIKPEIYQVNLSTIAMGDARVQVIHASPDAPAVDVAVKGGDVLIKDLAFPKASDALEVPAGSYDLEVRAAGTTTVALALPGVKLEAGMVYSVFAIGQLSDKSLSVLVIASSTTGAPMATPAA
jgi:hypothetical protein